MPFVVALLAVARVGAVAVPISTFSKAGELGDLLARSDAGAVVGISGYRGNDYVAALQEGCGLDLSAPAPIRSNTVPSLRRVHLEADESAEAAVLADHTLAALLAAGSGVDDDLLEAAEGDVAPGDRMVIVHTSGSTSAPKGVIHEHGPLLHHLDNLNRLRGLTAGVRLFSNSPMFWIGGLAYNVLGTLVAGATLLCATAPDTTTTLDFLERERPELVNGYAQSIAQLVADPTFAARDFSSIRSGNLYAIMPEPIRPRDAELRHNMLGMTEAGSVCLMDPDESDQPEHRRGSFGRPVPELEARIVDPETLVECGTGELGELWLRGPVFMEGYYGRERWTTFTPDEWYRTGDLFSRDARRPLLLRRATRRHDQDRWRERVTARGRGRSARGHRRAHTHRVRRARRRARRDRRGRRHRRRRRCRRPAGAARRAAGAPVRVQGAANDRAVRAPRAARAVERQAGHASHRGGRP